MVGLGLIYAFHQGLKHHELTKALVSLPASFTLWLASPEARFLKGKYLWANWDVDELKARSTEIASTTELNIGLVGWPFGDPEWKSTWNE
jgi:hypothetical protein